MNMHASLLASLLPVLLIPGCAADGSARAYNPDTPTAAETDPQPAEPRTLDGRFGDWAADEWAAADERWLWIRFAPDANPPQAIQAAPYTTRLRFDADLDPRTGREMAYPPMKGEAIAIRPQGVDLTIDFSPPNKKGTIGIGTGVTRYDHDAKPTDLGHAAIGMACLPTYANSQYELRIDRLAPGSAVLPKSGTVEIVVEQVDARGNTRWWQRIVTELPERAASPTRHDLDLPRKHADGVRIMSANVLFSSPLESPEPFKRVFDATQPDVILYQEWFRTERSKVEAWLKRSAGRDWSLHFPDERAGVAIATRHPILARYDKALVPSGAGHPARACAALIDTDAGELLAISVHLKCCGAAGSEEDLTRIDQAKAINAFVDWVHEQHPDAMVVIGGDFNLVGSRTPLDVMTRELGTNNDDLDPVHATVLGDATAVTWVDEKSRFAPGRLDWMLYDDSRSVLRNAFMLDTRVLDDDALQAMGLRRQDSAASDHLPMIVDLQRAD